MAKDLREGGGSRVGRGRPLVSTSSSCRRGRLRGKDHRVPRLHYRRSANRWASRWAGSIYNRRASGSKVRAGGLEGLEAWDGSLESRRAVVAGLISKGGKVDCMQVKLTWPLYFLSLVRDGRVSRIASPGLCA